ncbi:hypothetical protein SAICODRAFT_25796 [Saitoella complicata NRRL Y-17804]|uniref:uncharacterized protein n=1 Tax=Saitoella complicata (strain BCRC 22490 / CBS 7301 / JCM 7358 / NBRC 10748 / NRRL Y-17804) TaxID=698492 RepID=UPI0008679EB2|nr:uncharacterized protein SAICODRAFT_25796 [Saitoella complicata NRRL Y-17804]ODQ52484.1 hypothetical protein SAICODRAFT_25796 [Saitoella complicata NRRL Y-17804]
MTVTLPQNEKVGPWDQGQPGPTWVNSIAWGPWVPTSKDTFTSLVAALTDNGGVYLITMEVSRDGKLTQDPNIVTASPPNPRKPTQITWWHADECADTGMCVLASTSVGKITVYFCNVLEGTISVVEHLWEGYALATDMCFTPDASPLLHVMTSLGNAIVLKILPGTQSVDVSHSLTSRLKAHLEARRKAFAVGDDQINADIRIWGATLSPGGGCLAYAYENVASKTIRYVTNVEAAMRIGFFPTQEGAEYMAGMKALALNGLRSAVMNVYRQSLRGMLWDPTIIYASILKTNGSDAADEFLEQAWHAIDAASAFDSDADVTGHAIDHQLAISLFQPKFNAMRLVYAWWQGLQGFKNIKHRVFASDLSSVMADLGGHLAVTALHIFTTTCPAMIAPPAEGSLSYQILTLYADFIKQAHSDAAGVPELAANVYQLLGADPSPEHGRESCLACGSGIKWEDPMDAKCDNNHTWSEFQAVCCAE